MRSAREGNIAASRDRPEEEMAKDGDPVARVLEPGEHRCEAVEVDDVDQQPEVPIPARIATSPAANTSASTTDSSKCTSMAMRKMPRSKVGGFSGPGRTSLPITIAAIMRGGPQALPLPAVATRIISITTTPSPAITPGQTAALQFKAALRQSHVYVPFYFLLPVVRAPAGPIGACNPQRLAFRRRSQLGQRGSAAEVRGTTDRRRVRADRSH